MINGNQFLFYSPTKIYYGAGVLEKIGQVAKELMMKRCLVVIEKPLIKVGLIENISKYLTGLTTILYEKDEGEPNDKMVEIGVQIFKKNNCDSFIAIGGGSTIDTAKAVRIVAEHGGEILDYEGSGKVKSSKVPLISVPTTAGTGSSVGGCAVITDTTRNFKMAIIDFCVNPNVAIADPLLTRSLSPAATAATGFDALAQAIGAYTVNISHPMTDALAIYSIEVISRSIYEAVKNGDNVEARSGMMIGNLTSGLAMNNTECALDHVLAEPVSVLFHAPHGLSVGVFLPYAMHFNVSAVSAKFCKIANVMGENTEGLSISAAAYKAVEAVIKLSRKIGLPHLKDLKVQEEDLSRLAQMASNYEGMLDINPRKTSLDDLLRLYTEAYNQTLL